MQERRAEMGVGTLIIFIALLLVAAVAASVLLGTAQSLQQKSLSTGQQTKGEISTNIRVIEVSAVDGRNGTVENFSMQMKLSPGSEPIKLDELSLTLNTDTTTTTLTYLEPVNLSAGNYCQFNATSNTTRAEYCTDISADGEQGNYTTEYLINGTNHVDGNLQRGDVVRVYFQAPRSLEEDESLRINLIPKTGTATLVQTNLPDVISTERVYIYP